MKRRIVIDEKVHERQKRHIQRSVFYHAREVWDNNPNYSKDAQIRMIAERVADDLFKDYRLVLRK